MYIVKQFQKSQHLIHSPQARDCYVGTLLVESVVESFHLSALSRKYVKDHVHRCYY